MPRLAALVGLIGVVALLTSTGGAHAASGPLTTLAPPFMREQILLSPDSDSTIRSATANERTGEVTLAVSTSSGGAATGYAAARLGTTWRATFTGTAVFTATLELNGYVSAEALATRTLPPSSGRAEGAATLRGTIRAQGPTGTAQGEAVLAAVRAICPAVEGCVDVDGVSWSGERKQVQVTLAVRRGRTYNVGLELRGDTLVVENLVPMYPGQIGRGGASVCLGPSCAAGSASGGATRIVAVTVQPQEPQQAAPTPTATAQPPQQAVPTPTASAGRPPAGSNSSG